MHQLNNKQLLTVGVVLILVALVIAVVAGIPSYLSQGGSSSTTPTLPPPTLPTQQQIERMQNTPPFQYLVTYTNKGFVPSSFTVKEGQTVRFVNNSTQGLWVASIGTSSEPIYPGSSSCGASAFDSCAPLAPSDFWEFTFNSVGTWDFQNNAQPSQGGTITVLSSQ